MPIWNVANVSTQPSLSLSRWRIYETELGERHFVGFNIDDAEGRVSSAIQSFDPKTMRGITRSGRVYQLVANPGFDSDADYVWSTWRRINRVESFTDVTGEVLAKHGETT